MMDGGAMAFSLSKSPCTIPPNEVDFATIPLCRLDSVFPELMPTYPEESCRSEVMKDLYSCAFAGSAVVDMDGMYSMTWVS
jgi:hypothetical protein